jgi:hypothetical protein
MKAKRENGCLGALSLHQKRINPKEPVEMKKERKGTDLEHNF